ACRAGCRVAGPPRQADGRREEALRPTRESGRRVLPRTRQGALAHRSLRREPSPSLNRMGWTAYPEIDETLAALLSGSRAILGDNLFGMYLFGSLASGDFDADTSDIDFAVVTHAAVDAATQAELGQLNTRIQASG